MRELSKKFMDDLVESEGILNPILEHLKKDQTLMLAIRDGFINIYYRGGSILRITEQNGRFYSSFFDDRYNKNDSQMPILPESIKNQDNARIWVNSFMILKHIMDDFLSKYSKDEREFQQLVARENNCSSISNETEYFISDIEVYDPTSSARFDMIAIKWQTTKRKSGHNCRIAFIEMKYGDGALGGKTGLLKHLKDMESLITNKTSYANMLHVIENQFDQLDELKLMKFNKSQGFSKITLDPNEKPEVIFILANHNPRATALKTILNTPEIAAYGESQHFDLKFFVSSFAGYGMHAKCMLDLDEFRKLL